MTYEQYEELCLANSYGLLTFPELAERLKADNEA